MRFGLTDEECVFLEPLMPRSRKSARVDDRKIMMRFFTAGMPWRDLPDRYGPYTTGHNRSNRWPARRLEADF